MSHSDRKRRFFLKWLIFGGTSAAFVAACGGGSNVSSIAPVAPDAAESESVAAAFTRAPAVTFPQSVCTGDPTATSVVVWTRAVPIKRNLATVTVTLEVANDPSFKSMARSLTLNGFRVAGFNYRDRPGDYVVRTVLENLASGQQYYFRFRSPDGTLSPVGRFRTMPTTGRTIRFLHMSCANEPPYPIAGALGAEVPSLNPDFVLFNGDTVYADAFWLGAQPEPNLEFYRNLYRQQRDPSYTGAGFLDLFENAPFISNWDDHEVNDDYAGRGFLGAIQPSGVDVTDLQGFGYQSFFEYTPVQPRFSDDGGVPTQTRLFRRLPISPDLELFVLDLRQYRDLQGGIIGLAPIIAALPPGFTQEEIIQIVEDRTGVEITPLLQLALLGTPEFAQQYLNSTRTILGAPQKNWLLNALRDSTATFKVIVSELVFTENYALPYDRWEGYPQDRRDVINFVESNNIRNVIVLSGDQHAGQISLVNPTIDNQIPANPIWEIGTGPTGQSTLARSVDSIGASIGFPMGSDLYYELVNYLVAPTQFGGKPGATRNSHLFYTINDPNYIAVEVSGGRFVAQIKNSSGSVAIDPLGRRGEIEIFAS